VNDTHHDSEGGPAPNDGCQAWALGTLGGLVAGHRARERRPIGSLTKIMSTHLALRAAAERPERLDALVEISPAAAGCRGSSAELRAGEHVRLHDLLYAMMLPSGNDAALAVAEHLGACARAPVDAFVRAMNERAAALCLHDTQLVDPHGLARAGQRSSAVDLLRLTAQALADPRFRAIVATAEHRCTTAEGRPLVWRNTNTLLGRAGICGVKTGRTRTAGACLVACRPVGDTWLVAVVLGAVSREARFTLAETLLAWGSARRSA
jgi:serine-type D-Ala-D-Ala carboxypeptidase (penicillin-binding protein 5/6)